MITIYHLARSRSERVIWLMEELGLPYTLERFSRDEDGRAPPELYEIQALGKAPIIRDGDTLLVESAAVLEYIIHRHGSGEFAKSVDSSDYADYLQWLHFGEGSAMPVFMRLLHMTRLLKGVDQSDARVLSTKKTGETILKFCDAELARHPYFAGDELTAADIMMRMPFTVAGRILDLTPHKNIAAFLQRIDQRPAYQKAMAIADPPPAA